jgi:hypothetical protein
LGYQGDDVKSDQLASLLYTAFTKTEVQPLAATPKWEDLVPETRDRWVRMATVLCGLMQQKWEVRLDSRKGSRRHNATREPSASN